MGYIKAMSNAVEQALGGPSEDEINKMVQERVAAELAARERAQRLDVEKLKAEAEKAEEEKKKQEAIVKEEARCIAYLDSVQVDKIEDAATQKVVSAILASGTTSSREKVETVSRLIAASSIGAVMQKVEAIGDKKELLSRHSLDQLVNLAAKKDNLTQMDIVKAEDAMVVINEGLKKIGDAMLAEPLKGKVDYASMTWQEKHKHYASQMVLKAKQQRDEQLQKIRERIGVA